LGKQRGSKSLKEETSLVNLGQSSTGKIFIPVYAAFRKGKNGWLQNRYSIKLARFEKACLVRLSEKNGHYHNIIIGT